VYYADRATHTISKAVPGSSASVLVTAAYISMPIALAVDGAGALYVLAASPGDAAARRVFRVNTTSGTLTLIAGDGAAYSNTPSPAANGDGGLAAAAHLNEPDSIGVTPTGEIYVTEPARGRIRRITPDGRITTAAGQSDTNPTAPLNPDTGAAFSTVFGVSAAADGNVYFAGGSAGRVYRLSPQGSVVRIGGGPSGPPYLQDGDLASSREFGAPPAATAVGADGSVFLRFGLGGSAVSSIRRIGVDGILTTVAGDNTTGGSYQGDGGPALGNVLGRVQSIAIGPTGDLYL
jgi:streptogramin lyase